MSSFLTASKPTLSSSTVPILESIWLKTSDIKESRSFSSGNARASRTRLSKGAFACFEVLPPGEVLNEIALSLNRCGATSIVIEMLFASEYLLLSGPLGLLSSADVTSPAVSMRDRCLATKGCPRPSSFESIIFLLIGFSMT